MNTEAIITSGITAFLGAIAALSFQSWREHRNDEKNKRNVLSQAKSLIQQDLFLVEVFLENALAQNEGEQLHIPPEPTQAALTNKVTEKLAEYLTSQEYELVTLAQVTYMGSINQASEVRRLYFEFESRSLGAGRKFNAYEKNTIEAHIANYIKVLKNSCAAHLKAKVILKKAQAKNTHGIFNINYAIKYIPALILIYILTVSSAAVIFFVLWRQSV